MLALVKRMPVRLPPLALIATGCAFAIAACGDSSKPRSSAGAGGIAGAAVQFADCMRSHGVTSFPDAGSSGGIQIPSTINTQSPVYLSAQRACASLLPAPIARPKPSEHQKLLAVAFSRCVRVHGLPHFPDPSLNVPPPGAGSGIIRGRLYWPIPPDIVVTPAFKSAASACGWRISTPVAAAG